MSGKEKIDELFDELDSLMQEGDKLIAASKQRQQEARRTQLKEIAKLQVSDAYGQIIKEDIDFARGVDRLARQLKKEEKLEREKEAEWTQEDQQSSGNK